MRSAQLRPPRVHHDAGPATASGRPQVLSTLDWPGWEVHVASFGNATVTALPGPVPGAVLMEDPDGSGSSASPCIELSASVTGWVDVRCRCAPSVLLIGLGEHPVLLPEVPGQGRAASSSPAGGVLLAWTPSLLNALSVAEVAHAPKMVREEPDLDRRLRHWLRQADAGRVAGGAVLVARHHRRVGNWPQDGWAAAGFTGSAA